MTPDWNFRYFYTFLSVAIFALSTISELVAIKTHHSNSPVHPKSSLDKIVGSSSSGVSLCFVSITIVIKYCSLIIAAVRESWDLDTFPYKAGIYLIICNRASVQYILTHVQILSIYNRHYALTMKGALTCV